MPWKQLILIPLVAILASCSAGIQTQAPEQGPSLPPVQTFPLPLSTVPPTKSGQVVCVAPAKIEGTTTDISYTMSWKKLEAPINHDGWVFSAAKIDAPAGGEGMLEQKEIPGGKLIVYVMVNTKTSTLNGPVFMVVCTGGDTYIDDSHISEVPYIP